MDELALEPPSDGLGGSVLWALGMFRSNLASLAWVTFCAAAISMLAVVTGTAFNIAAESVGYASLMTVTSVVGPVLLFIAYSYAMMGLTRTWSMIARGAPVRLEPAFALNRFSSFLIAGAIVTPVLLFSFGLVVAFAFAIGLYVVGDGLPVGAAMGRALSDTCGSAKSFFHTLLIGVLFTMFATFAVLTGMWVALEALAASISSSISSFFDGSLDNRFREADEALTFGLGASLGALLAAGLLFAVVNVFGLWIAAHVRRLTGRPLGSRLVSDPETLRVA